MEEFRRQALLEMRQFKNKAKEEYRDFRAKANAEYAEFLKHAWEERALAPSIEPPKIDPPVQPVAPPRIADKPISPKPIVFGGVKPMPKPVVPKMPKIDVPEVKPEEEPLILKMPVNFYGATCNIRLKPGTGEVQLSQTTEEAVSKAWLELADGRYDLMLETALLYATLCVFATGVTTSSQRGSLRSSARLSTPITQRFYRHF